MEKSEFEKLSPDEREATLKFIRASVQHTEEQFERAKDTVPRLEDKLDKMRAYAKLIVDDTEEALINAKAEVEAAEGRWHATRGLYRVLVGVENSRRLEDADSEAVIAEADVAETSVDGE